MSWPSNLYTMTVQLIKNFNINIDRYPNQYVGCLVLTKDNKILLQQRPHDWPTYPDYLCEFGGRIEHNESPEQAVIRELKEELGGNVKLKELVSFGAITESISKHKELIHTFFWHDKEGTITGCYEGLPRFFNESAHILLQTKITDGLRWLIDESKKLHLIK
ncbi:Nudix hydrolase domain-containing protein [Legionella pneumophila subsp. pneumophila]|uniref:NUDIX domain-containing protein n=2 Tax=Legionellaceae TaxID=444 RepID=UPI0023507033|nr:NUDIX hydrolase [Legionella pneumophila]MDC8030487.1 Nudix hydrolase domain-containing protein [Legionella pneumophila subsp. pneumophila]